MIKLDDAFQARATHASHRARILGLGLSVGIAIALAGCTPPSLRAGADAGDTAYSTVAMLATDSDWPKEAAAAKAALADAKLTNAEYDHVMSIGDAYKAKACGLAKRVAAEAASGRRSAEDTADVGAACELGVISTDRGIYLARDWDRFASGMPPREDPQGLRPKAGSPVVSEATEDARLSVQPPIR